MQQQKDVLLQLPPGLLVHWLASIYLTISGEPSWSLRNSHLQAALTLCLTLQVGGSADIDTPIIGTGLPDLQGQYSLLAEHAKTSIFSQVQAILEPGNLGLRTTPDSTAEDGIVACNDGAVCQGLGEAWGFREVQGLVFGWLICDAWSRNKDGLLGGSSSVTGAHHVMAEDPEVVAIANDKL